MFSKKSIHYLVASVLSISMAGCGEFLKGKKAEPEVIEFTDTRFVCLQKVPNQIQKFSIGEAQESEIRSGFDCVSEALRYFNKRTFGSVKGAYSSEEMRNFFGKYFLKENNVSPEFAAELMKIKRALLGGSVTSITKQEITSLIRILAIMRDEFVEMAPHMKILLLQKSPQTVQWDNVSVATEQLRRSFQRLLDKTQIADSDYGFEDAKKALAGFAEFVRGGQPTFAPYERYSTWVPAVEAVKNVLMGKRVHFADLDQWKDSLNTLLELYELFLRYHYSLQDLKFEDAGKVRQASQFVGQTLKLLQNAHQMKFTGRIPIEDIDNLIVQIRPLMDVKLSEKALKKAYRTVLMKILNPGERGDSRAFLGLERKHLATFQREFNIWRLQQSFIDSLEKESSAGGVTQQSLYRRYLQFNKSYVIERGLSDDPFEQNALSNAWEDLADLLKSSLPLMFDEKGRLVIDHRHADRPQTWRSMTKANLMRALSRLLILGYGDNTQGHLSAAKMTKAGLIAWYDDFSDLGKEVKAFDPRSANSGARSFLEANFFTFSGNGNDVMDHRETFEFVSTLFSAGLGISDDVREHMVAARCTVAQNDVFDFPFIKEDCFKNQLRKHLAVYFNNMPGMVNYVKSLSQPQWEEFYHHLSVAAAVDDQKKGFVETANIRSMVMILHYIEAIVVLYDRDRSQGLSLAEVYAAAPRFMSFFKTVGKTNSETLLEEGFAYLVFKGSIPGAGALAGFQWSKLWGLDEAQRMEIVRLFGTLKKQMSTDSL